MKRSDEIIVEVFKLPTNEIINCLTYYKYHIGDLYNLSRNDLANKLIMERLANEQYIPLGSQLAGPYE